MSRARKHGHKPAMFRSATLLLEQLENRESPTDILHAAAMGVPAGWLEPHRLVQGPDSDEGDPGNFAKGERALNFFDSARFDWPSAMYPYANDALSSAAPTDGPG